MSVSDWIPVVVAFVAGLISFLPVYWKERKAQPEVLSSAARQLGEGAGELVAKYQELIERMEKQIECLEKDNLELKARVRKLERQVRELGAVPSNGN